MPEQSWPVWYDGKRVHEVLFATDFLKRHPMYSLGGSFFNEYGRIHDESVLEKEIYQMLRPVLQSGLSKKAAALMDVLRVECQVPELPVLPDRCYVANGTYWATGRLEERMEMCRYRLPVAYRRDAPPPRAWLRFLDQLLQPEDILTLQEFMGYCLLPTNMAQKMLMIVGRGGEGKSRIGVVLRALFGENMVNGSFAKLELNRFARADLEHRLLMVDDDMKMEALPQTNYIKSIVTADVPMDLERKNKQSHQGLLYCRLIGFGNGSIKALYDRSEGFFRRQIILSAKPKPKDREDNPYLGSWLCQETEGILRWCTEGLLRLIDQDFKFTLSEQARENIADAELDANNVVSFLQAEDYIRHKADGEISSRRLYELYQRWCEDNALHPLSAQTVVSYLHENASKLGLEYSMHVQSESGTRCRGFVGLCESLSHWPM